MRRAVALTVAACAGVWILTRWVVYDFFQLGDTRVYEHAARMVDAGAIPYADFDVEYPPLATALFWLVGRLPGEDYQLAFSLAMSVCLIATALATLVLARRLGLGRGRTAVAVGLVALTPLLLGTLVQTRYDLLLAALLGWTVVAALRDRFGWAWTLLAVATAVKLVPVLLVPALYVWHRHRRPARSARRGVTGFGVGVAATFAPFVAIAPDATWRLFRYHLDRPPEVESLASSIVHAAGLDFRSVQSYGSDNVTGSAVDLLAGLSTALVAVCVVAVALWLRRGLTRPHADDAGLFVAAIAATLVASVAFGKVISPQYMVWLLPAVVVIPGLRGRVALTAMILALPLTQLVFPPLFSAFVERAAQLPVWLLLVRNALLLVLLFAVWPRRGSRPDTGAPTPTVTPDPADSPATVGRSVLPT